MNNKKLKIINDIKRNAAMNMALDDMLFNKEDFDPVLRTYLWDGPYTTIGFFQKSAEVVSKDFVRRFTGGLTVNHHKDLSYSFIATTATWAYIYNQNETYKHIHLSIQKALNAIGINCLYLDKQEKNISNMCLQTLYENDLVYNGKKVVGSCLRRRGNKILLQGSLHIDLEEEKRKVFYKVFAESMAEVMNMDFEKYSFTEEESIEAQKISIEKYLNKDWNYKF